MPNYRMHLPVQLLGRLRAHPAVPFPPLDGWLADRTD